MDFRNCPACKASVLEDDVEDCPFCGASMSGKPSARPAAKPAQATAKTTTAAPRSQPSAGAKAAAAPATKKRPADPLDDGSDPFEVDTRAVVKAPPVSPKPAKGRMVRVVCPMCETPGFIPPQLQGKDVKCCNADCLMPVFMAPKPEAKPVEEAPKRSTASIIFMVSAAVLILIVAGVGYHFIKGELANDAKDDGVAKNQQREKIDREDIEFVRKAAPPTGPQEVPLQQVRETVLADIEKSAQQSSRNRSKPFGRRMAAEAFAGADMVDGAREQLADMQKVKGYVKFYEIEPLVMIADVLSAQGDAAGAKQALDDALSKAELPAHGREPLDAASRLAVALMAAGRADDAHRVASLADDSGTRGRVFVLWRNALDSGSLDLDAPATRPWLQDMPSAQAVSVTLGLLARKNPEAALAWAQSTEHLAARDNALAAWAGGLALLEQPAGSSAAPAVVSAIVGEQTPTAQARIWAALADARFKQGKTAAVKECLTQAMAALDTLAAPVATRPVPSLRQIYDSEGQPRAGLPDPTEARSAALAATDIAQVQAAAGDPDAAWKSLQKALAFLRGSTPSPAATQALVSENDSENAAVKARLKSELELGDDRVFLAFNRYRDQCNALHKEATERFDLQVQLMRRAAAFGLLKPLWTEVAKRETLADLSEREPYFGTFLPGTIAAYSSSPAMPELQNAIQAAIPLNRLKIDVRDRLVLAFGPKIDTENFEQAADLLREYQQQEPGDYYTSQLIALRGISRLIKEGKHLQAMNLVRAVNDPLLREDAVQLIAAAAIRDGQHTELWERRGLFGLSATEMAAFLRGCIRGLNLRPADSGEPTGTTAG